MVKHIVVERHTGGYHLGDAPFYDFATLYGFGILELLADGHAFACPHQAGEVGVEGVVGESRECHM